MNDMKVSGQLHAPADLALRHEPHYQLDKTLRRRDSGYGRGGEDKSLVLSKVDIG
jgi:hypothetical protein